MANTKLDETTDFIELYEYVAGDWTTPPHFHRWAAISLIAACLEDRVWLQILEHAPLHPNLWVFLIGGSGVGKDHSIGLALSLLKPEDPILKVDGKVTMPALYDFLSSYQKASGRESAPVYLISSDVTEQLPLGPEAKDFTSRALALYGGRERPLMDLTRTSGTKIVNKPLLNWLAGCTPEWFPSAIDPQVFNSGFAGRAFFVVGEPRYEFFDRESPTVRRDRDLVLAHLRTRVERMQTIEGLFVMEPQARIYYRAWLQGQKERMQQTAFSDIERAVLNRQRTSVQKLCMIFAMSSWREGDILRITAKNVDDAIQHAQVVIDGARIVGDFAYTTVDSAVLNRVLDAVRGSSSISRTRLLREMTSRGVKDAKHLDVILDTLKQAGYIRIAPQRIPGKSGPPTLVVSFLTRKIPTKPAQEETTDGTS